MRGLFFKIHGEIFVTCVMWFLSFVSIGTLLGFLYGFWPMHELGRWALLPSFALIIAFWFWAKRKEYHELTAALTLGFWGGLIGTIGYDLARLPLHYLGLNPFAPIRSYGMFLLNTPHSTFGSDVAGAMYHFSNGVTFGWIYSLVMRRRSLWWAVLWGLILETLAVASPFGSIYGIRTAYPALVVAYVGHIFYGLPLGWVTKNPKKFFSYFVNRRKLCGLGFMGIVMAGLMIFFTFAWEQTKNNANLPSNTIKLGSDAIYPGWIRIQQGESLTIKNNFEYTVELQIRKFGKPTPLLPSEDMEVKLMPAGIYQLVVFNQPWRSAFISVEENGYPVEN